MAFPIINFKSTNTEPEPRKHDLLEQKLRTLEKFIGDEEDVKCDAEFEKVAPQQSGRVHRVEVNLWVHGHLYRAESTQGTFDEAIDEVRDELDKEMRRASEKRETLVKKGGRKIKEEIRFGE